MPPLLRYIPLVLLLTACTPDIHMPAPAELAVKQVGYGHATAVELSWRVVIRAGGYLVEYGEQANARNGSGLKLVQWAAGCGDFDMSTREHDGGPDKGIPEAGPADAGWPGVNSPSPVRVPAAWCLERANTYSDAGIQPVTTPASRPRLRLSGVQPGKTYYFAVRSYRLASTSGTSSEVSITPVKDPPKGTP